MPRLQMLPPEQGRSTTYVGRFDIAIDELREVRGCPGPQTNVGVHTNEVAYTAYQLSRASLSLPSLATAGEALGTQSDSQFDTPPALPGPRTGYKIPLQEGRFYHTPHTYGY